MKHNFQHNLYFYRTQKQWNQKQTAYKLGISPTTYQQYESGVTEPRVTTLLRIAQFYNVSVDELIGAVNE